MLYKKLINRFLAFFFDFDGVLVDSVDIKGQAFAKLFEPYGPEIVKLVVSHHHNHTGVARTVKFRHYYSEFLKLPLGDEELNGLCQRFSRIVINEVINAPEISGAEAFLKRLQPILPCFIISAVPEEEIKEIARLRGLSKYFRMILGTPASKKENIQMVLEKMEIVAASCLFFGDAESDYNAAKTCGVNFIGILPDADAPLLKAFPDINWVNDFNQINLGKAIARLPPYS